VGAPGAYSHEKDINLSVALQFGKYVEANNPDVKVIYTRKTDVFLPLIKRANIANQNNADLFISIHTNALSNGKIARGFETYILGDGRSQGTKANLEVIKRENDVIFLEKDYRKNYPGYGADSPEENIFTEFKQQTYLTQSAELAKMMQRNVCSMASCIDKGAHQANLHVLRETYMTSCLLELGFISTPDQEKILNDKTMQDRFARGIYNAFVEYKNKYFTGINVPLAAETPLLPAPQETDNKAEETPQQAVEEASIPIVETAKPAEDAPQRQAKEVVRSSEETSTTTLKTSDRVTDKPIFKVQIIAATRRLKSSDAAFKGLQGCESYEEGGMTKYTYGASEDYNAIYRTRKELLDRFPEAFIIAFKNGEKMNINQAISEFKKNKKK